MAKAQATVATPAANENRRQFVRGSARQVSRPGKGKMLEFIDVSFNRDDVEFDEKGYGRITLLKKDAVDQYSNTHAILGKREATA